MTGSFNAMWKNEGVKGFFKGNGVNCIKIGPFSAIEFWVYSFYKDIFLKEKSFLGTVFTGGLTGVTATIFTYPLDLAKTFLSIQTSKARYNGVFDCIKQIYIAEGVKGC